MKSAARTAAGDAAGLARRPKSVAWLAVPLVLAACGLAFGQSLYKYKDENGNWIYTDRKPDSVEDVEIRSLKSAPKGARVSVTHELRGSDIQFTAHNRLYAPVEVALIFDTIAGIEFPDSREDLRWVVPPRSELPLLSLAVMRGAGESSFKYRYSYLPGDPAAVHRADQGYRVPFVAGSKYPVSQAYPDARTHSTAGSMYAVDIAMPVGTDVLAARDGVVFEVVGKNFRGGTNAEEHATLANVVSILHDDGTFAVYAHLNWDSIRVTPGERVLAGQYIADSGNTGFSSGPHLHFAVQRNTGMRVEALPVVFRGPNSSRMVPATGRVLTAYP